MRRPPTIKTKPTAAEARARHAKDVLRSAHRRGEHAEKWTARCPLCWSERGAG